MAIGCMLMIVLLWWLNALDAFDEGLVPILMIVVITTAGVSLPWVAERLKRNA